MLQVAFDCTEEAERSQVRTVFASRHGAIHVAVKILAEIAKAQPVSPLQFSHSVHNTQAGLFSIATGNRSASSSIAGEADTFAHGFLDAVLPSARPAIPALRDRRRVAARQPDPPAKSRAPPTPSRCSARRPATPLDFSLEASRAPRKAQWPDALSSCASSRANAEPTLETGRRSWRWQGASSPLPEIEEVEPLVRGAQAESLEAARVGLDHLVYDLRALGPRHAAACVERLRVDLVAGVAHPQRGGEQHWAADQRGELEWALAEAGRRA
jgi:hypothetical protein